MQKLLAQKKLPQGLTKGFLAFCTSYAEAVKEPPVDALTTFVQQVMQQLEKPYDFQPYHMAIRAPLDYYKLGLDFVRPLIDFSKSKVLGKEGLTQIQEAISRNENVVLLANHQTEIDPQIISLLLEKDHPQLAVDMIFVAGHRVTTDPLAVPLSLGRNLICIYSKRHIEEPPEKKVEKLQHNQRALKVLEELLTTGGKCIYIAPSGGRDRLDDKGDIQVAPFDPQAVEMFYLLSQRAKRPTNFHSLALHTFWLLPPPKEVLTEIGEERKTYFSPASLYFGPRIDMEKVGDVTGEIDKKEKRRIRTTAIYNEVLANYARLINNG
jgi:glycerol-3-phosphate O-acyltransferase